VSVAAVNAPRHSAREFIERIPLAWLFVPALLISCTTAASRPQTSDTGKLAWFVTFVCVAGIVCQVFRWKAAIVFLFVVTAIHWAVVLIAVELGLVALFQGGLYGLVVGAGIAIVALFLAVPLAVIGSTMLGLKAGAGWPLGAFGAAFILAALITFSSIRGHERHALGRHASHYLAVQPPELAPDLITIDKCLLRYSALHPNEGFPASIEALGRQGIGCLPDALLESKYKGYEISYQPAPRNAAGNVSAYQIVATESPRGEDYAVASTNQSGVVTCSFPGPTRRGVSYAYNPAWRMEYVLECLSKVNTTSELLANLAVRDCARNRGVVPAEDGKMTADGYYAKFSFDIRRYTILGFTLQARPRVYGVGGLHSYLIVGTHAPCSDPHQAATTVYATIEDRPATTSDPAPEEWQPRTCR
jgi:hypothetical protein